MLTQLRQSVLTFALFLVLCGLAYPFAMTGLAGALFPTQAHGSLIQRDGKVVGSALIGQLFTKPEYFHGRPSATTDTDPNDPAKTVPAPYNAANSGASNAAPTAKSLVSDVAGRVEALKQENPGARLPVPVDLVTSSGSGLDPHISPAAAEYQVPRVAAARSMDQEAVRRVVAANTEGRTFGLLGEPRVNLLELNLALDRLTAGK